MQSLSIFAFNKDYPSLLAQGVYTCFCESFPDSYRQFGEHFKEDLVNLVFEWITGKNNLIPYISRSLHTLYEK